MPAVSLNLPSQHDPAARLDALEALIVMVGAGRFIDLPNGRLFMKLVFINRSVDLVGRESDVPGGMPLERHLSYLRQQVKNEKKRQATEARNIGRDLRAMGMRRPPQPRSVGQRPRQKRTEGGSPPLGGLKREGKTERDREKRRSKAAQQAIRAKNEARQAKQEAAKKAAVAEAKKKAKKGHLAA